MVSALLSLLMPLAVSALRTSAALHASTIPTPPRSALTTACASSTSADAAADVAAAAATVRPPRDEREMLSQAAATVKAARADGINRHVLRLFLTRDGELTPPDESWQGGIMQLYGVASPLARELLRLLSTEIAGVPPSLTEQRLDASGVDGESVWMAQSSRPADDAVGFVQPSAEQLEAVTRMSNDAGVRPVLLINPQWKERDDPLDALSKRGGVIGTLGSFLGGKAATMEKLNALGYVDVYTLAEYRCRGSLICLQLVYPRGWTAFYREGVADETWKELITCSQQRPTYQQVELPLTRPSHPPLPPVTPPPHLAPPNPPPLPTRPPNPPTT